MLLSVCFLTNAQQVTVSGTLTDGSSGEKLIGATVAAEELRRGTVSNQYGFYTIRLPKDQSIKLKYSFAGYGSVEIELWTGGDTLINLSLPLLELDEVTVFAERRRVFSSSINETQIVSPKNLPYPSLKPEIDILDVVMQLPGVQPGLEGSVGFSVRGGNNDQNLIVMDDVMLYNVGHFANFMSIFDPYAINSMTFYKGGFPAKFGGRVSSVLDIYMKEGDTNKFKGEANIGLFSTKLALEGPIGERTSYLFSFRRSTVDLLLAGIYTLTKPDSRFFYNFHDLNVKINQKVDPNNHLYLSLYDGNDRLVTNSESNFQVSDTTLRQYSRQYLNRWGSRSISLRWNHVFNNRAFNNLTVAYSGFRYLLDSKDEILDNSVINNSNSFIYSASIDDLIVKNDVEIPLMGKNKLGSGIHLISHMFQPVAWQQERIHFYGTAVFSSENFVKLNATELFGYIQGQFFFNNDKLVFSPGIRAGRYFLPGNVGFNLIEPRLGLSWALTPRSNLSFNYDKMGQTVHSLNSSGTSLTAVVWVPATERLRPTVSHQLSFGWQKSFLDRDMEVVAGAYYKEMTDLIDFDGNTGFATIEGEWDGAITSGGFGRAYGFEVMANKNFTDLSLEANYTFSRSIRRFATINHGNFFPQNFDRPHNLSLSSIYRLNQKITFSAMFNYFTGQPITLGTELFQAHNNHFFFGNNNVNLGSSFFINPEEAMVVDNINNYRMPDYHRLDVSFIHKKGWKNGWERTLSVSVYNIYNRQNAYFIFTDRSSDGINFKKLTLFPILPSFSYQVNF